MEESPDDFESCLCGGKLVYTETNPEKDLKENYRDDESAADENGSMTDGVDERVKLICPNCLREDEHGLFCSDCGGKILQMKNGKVVNRKTEDYLFTKKLPEQSPKENLPSEPINDLKSLFKRIKLVGVLAGIILLVIGILTVFYSVVSMLSFNYYYYDDINYNDFQFFFNVLFISLLLIGISSGVLASYINKYNDLVDGLLNGFMVGIVSSVILGAYGSLTYSVIGGILIIMVGIPVFGSLSSVGGVIGIFICNKLEDFRK
ncbi:MAG: hypothetical protein HY802_02060 [Methanobacterium sp.]|nr:hypothetical protein [Methanobacterium sp.]